MPAVGSEKRLKSLGDTRTDLVQWRHYSQRRQLSRTEASMRAGADLVRPSGERTWVKN